MNSPSKPSFFVEDEDDGFMVIETPISKRRKRKDDSEEDQAASKWQPRASPRPSPPSSRHSSVIIVDGDSDDGDKSSTYIPSPKSTSPPPTKKRRLSSPSAPDPSRLSLDPRQPPSKSPEPTLKSTFLGHIVIDDAWATSGGKGLLAAGNVVRIYRDREDVQQSSRLAKTNGSDKKKSSAKGQPSITSMMKKPAPPPPAHFKGKKAKEDVIVRFANSKGQEIGRLPNRIATWVSKLLDKAVIRVTGSVIECPSPLRTGCHIILSLRFDILPTAFNSVNRVDHSTPNPLDMIREGSETDQEKFYSDRKKSLMELFDALSLKPVKKARITKLDAGAIAFTKEKQKVTSGIEKPKAKEVIGEGEEVEEVEVEGEELSSNQLDVIYKRAQQNDREMAELDPPDSFALTLRPYQRQALCWMSSIENGTSDARQTDSMHPLWQQYTFPYEPTGDVIDLCEDEEVFYYNPYSGQLSLKFPSAERNCRGGILADVGMGKTVMVTSLIHFNRHLDTSMEESQPSLDTSGKPHFKQGLLSFKSKTGAQNNPSSGRCPTATLIVAPLSLLAQWKSELDRASKPGSLRTMIFHGTSRGELDSIADAEPGSTTDAVDIVITSYGTLSSEHSKLVRGGTSPLYQIEWMRVVLDEAHYAKSRNTKTAKACYALRARRRWALTGTPIVNRLEDLFSLLHFLRDEPWSDFAFFKSCIITPFLNQDPSCLDVVQAILESILLRREKTMKDKDGNPIVRLPPKEVTIQELEFSPMERKIYDSVYADAKNAYDRFSAGGLVGKNMSNILAMLMRLRRAVLHPSLIRPKRITDVSDDSDVIETNSVVPKPRDGRMDLNTMIARFTESGGDASGSEEKLFAVEALKNAKDIEQQECPLCLDTMDDPVLIPECHHAGCKVCIVEHIQSQEEKGQVGFCPVCQRRPLKERNLIEVLVRRKIKGEDDIESKGHTASSPEIVLRQNDFVMSTKLDALAQHLRQLREREPTFRAIVFSQFTGFLDLIEVVLHREGLIHYRLDGTMSQKKRTEVLREFAEPSKEPKIFAISLKAGGVGLNLTDANHVFMMDCWWNSAVESQAIDRVHRIGQNKPVYVTHFIISKTIEARILAIQRRKTAIVKGALGGIKGKGDTEAFENLKLMFESQ